MNPLEADELGVPGRRAKSSLSHTDGIPTSAQRWRIEVWSNQTPKCAPNAFAVGP